jgi:hypothetical protein
MINATLFGKPLRTRQSGELIPLFYIAYNRYILMSASFSETEAIGIRPLFPSPRHLVWDSASGNLCDPP